MDIINWFKDFVKKYAKSTERNSIHQTMVAVFLSMITYMIINERWVYVRNVIRFNELSLPLKILVLVVIMYGLFTVMYIAGVVFYGVSNFIHQRVKSLIGL